MSDVKLFSQTELVDLNATLALIQKNLNTHVNENLSKAHAVKIIQQDYFDSSGDLVGHYVMEFQFGNPPSQITLYVPVRQFGAALMPADPGPRDLGDGISHSAISPTGTSTSPGVPIGQKALVTSSPADISLSQATVYNELLLLHSIGSINDIRELQVHGGITFSSDPIFDTLGHTVGRKTINIGYNGILYKLPADLVITGPTQGPRISFEEPATIIIGGSSSPNFRVTPPPSLTIGAGDKPYTFQWQVQNQVTNVWENLCAAITVGGPVEATNTVFTTKPGIYTGTFLSVTARLISNFGTRLGSPFEIDAVRMGASKNVQYPFIIRCLISNVGGVSVSKTWFCASNNYNGDNWP